MNETLLDFLRSPTGGNPTFALEGLLERLCDSIDEISERLDSIEQRLDELTHDVAALSNGKPLNGLTFTVIKAAEWE